MPLFYEQRNLDNIAKLADHTKAAALKWHDYCVKNNINVLVYETIRTAEKQRENVRNGKSQTMRSYHLVGQALDFVPVDDKGNTLWSIKAYTTSKVQEAINYAKSLGFTWGGDWNNNGDWRDEKFLDSPHLQFNYKGYGTDTFTKEAPKTETKAEVYEEPNKEIKPAHSPAPAIPKSSGDDQIKAIQIMLNSRYNSGVTVDGYYGPKTKQALLKGLQKELNRQDGVKLALDGIWGPKTKAACVNVRKNARGNIVWILQAMLYCKGYNTRGVDGIFGDGTANAVLAFQKANKLAQDAIAGANTFEELFA